MESSDSIEQEKFGNLNELFCGSISETTLNEQLANFNLEACAPPTNMPLAEEETGANLTPSCAKPANDETKVPTNESKDEPELESKDEQLERIYQMIAQEVRLLVLMRGLPGSGKSTLARELITKSPTLRGFESTQFVCSTDEFFINARGRYIYNKYDLPRAHEWNQKRVREKMIQGWAPVVVDNTNLEIAHMMPYLRMAVKYGYIVELLEPRTNWRYQSVQLAERNRHNVTQDRIECMQLKFQPCIVENLLSCIEPYKVNVPQKRALPKLLYTTTMQSINNTDITEILNKPKEQRKPLRAKFSEHTEEATTSENEENHTWQPYEVAAASFWQQRPQPTQARPAISRPPLLDLLRDECQNANRQQPTATVVVDNKKDDVVKILKRHSINCAQELPDFVQLRQMYPNQPNASLWDLFKNCNGDLRWCVDILLNESDQLKHNDANAKLNASDDKFICDCQQTPAIDESIEQLAETVSGMDTTEAQASGAANPKPQRIKRNKLARGNDAALEALARDIEVAFHLPDEINARRIDSMRNSVYGTEVHPNVHPNYSNESWNSFIEVVRSPTESPTLSTSPSPERLIVNNSNIENSNVAGAEEREPDDYINVASNSNYGQIDAFCELNLDLQFIQQLRNKFETSYNMNESSLPTKVFLPETLARELHLYWLQAYFNHLDNQHEQTLRNDENFAQMLANENCADCVMEQQPNTAELLDMELAWNIYDSERMIAEKPTSEPAENMATVLTKHKLCEMFPEIAEDTVLTTYESLGFDYKRTITALGGNNAVNSRVSSKELFDKVQNQNDLQAQKPTQRRRARSTSPEDYESAVQGYEKYRNIADHHMNQKAECNKKAQQERRGFCTTYYTQIAQLHDYKMHLYRQRALAYFIRVRKFSGGAAEDMIDLHWLSKQEALCFIDLFLDYHIETMRTKKLSQKRVVIITGRGNHSANGISVIKCNVKRRLRQRNLYFEEENPGCLRVKLVATSRTSDAFETHS